MSGVQLAELALVTSPAFRARCRALLDERVDPAAIALRRHIDGLPSSLLAQQLDCLYRAQRKLGRFFHPDLVCTRQAIEQCSSAATADWKARHCGPPGHGGDCTSGLGVDGWALSDAGWQLACAEQDPVLAALLAHNRKVLDLPAAAIHQGDGVGWLQELPTPPACVLIDPARRSARGRSLDIRHCQPDLTAVAPALVARSPRVVAKLAPGVHHAAIAQELPQAVTLTVLSCNGECREAVVDLEPDHGAALQRVAVLLSDRGEEIHHLRWDGDPHSPVGFPHTWILDPDPAIRVADLGATLARQFAGHLLHPQDQLVTVDKLPSDVPGRCYRVLAWEQGSLKSCRRYCHQHGIRAAHILRRGIADKPERIRAQLRLQDANSPTLICTRDAAGKPLWIHAERHAA